METANTEEEFEQIVSGIEPETDEMGFKIIPNGRRSFKFDVEAEGIFTAYVFAENPTQAVERAREHFDIPDNIKVSVRRIPEGGGSLNLRLN